MQLSVVILAILPVLAMAVPLKSIGESPKLAPGTKAPKIPKIERRAFEVGLDQ
jgi:hypothetical protein